MDKDDKLKMIAAAVYPMILLVIIWTVFYIDRTYVMGFYEYGILPLEVEGLKGIIFWPFIHSTEDYSHIFNNSIPLFVLGWSLFYFYKDLGFKVLLWIWLMSGVWVWISARTGSYHIGASGVVYGLAAFLFFSGAIRKEMKLMAISLMVTFLYGSMVWGIFPYKESMSFEGHLWGGIAGMLLAFYYKKDGPQRPKYQWEIEEELEEEWEKMMEQRKKGPYVIHYEYKPKESEEDNSAPPTT
jgi:membrane associated rhomboid family serine protease